MALDRELGDLKSGGHLPVPRSTRHETENLALTRGEDRRHLSIPASPDGADRGAREIASQWRLALGKRAEACGSAPRRESPCADSRSHHVEAPKERFPVRA